MKTVAEKILSAKAHRDAQAGDVVVCDVDLVLGTDASSPMAIAYFERMGGTKLFDPTKVLFALDHYSPPSSPKTREFHETIRRFASTHGATVFAVGEGISFQIVSERRLARAGDLVIGADSHTVTCGALGLFATGVGSSDLAAAMITGQIWLRVPETIKVVFEGNRPPNVSAKDVALAMVAELGLDGANYQCLEFHGSAAEDFSFEDRLVLSNLAVEADAKAAIWPDERVMPDVGAHYVREVALDLTQLTPRIALPHQPDNVVALADATGVPVHMVFIGTCTGGRVSDFHEALSVLVAAGGTVAPGVQLVITPASGDIAARLTADGTLARFTEMGAIVTTAGCGACCGTSGVIPGDGMNVLSTANRNFKARMGNPTASIYLASPATCAAAAAAGHIP